MQSQGRFSYSLYVTIAFDEEDIAAKLKENNIQNAVILYPDFNHSSSSSGARRYQASILTDGNFVRDKTTEALTTVSIGYGDLILPASEGLTEICERTDVCDPAKIMNQAFVGAGIACPKDIWSTLLSEDMTREQQNAPVVLFAKNVMRKKEEEKTTTAAIIGGYDKDLQQADAAESTTRSAKTVTVEEKITQFEYKNEEGVDDPEEVIPACIPRDAKNIIREYCFGEPFIGEHAEFSQPAQIRFFGRRCLDFLHAQATELGTRMVRRAKAEDVEAVCSAVSENPKLKDVVVTVIDRFGTPITGTLPALAVMGNDVDHYLAPGEHMFYSTGGDYIKSAPGFAEKLRRALGLSKEEFAGHLACINSDEAKKVNQDRNERYLSLMVAFGETILAKEGHDIPLGSYDYNKGSIDILKAFQGALQPQINQLESELIAERKKEVHAGSVFDLRIIKASLEWYLANERRFGRYTNTVGSYVFLINGIGKLQRMVTARDVHLLMRGAWCTRSDGPTDKCYIARDPMDFYNRDNLLGLGRDYFLGKPWDYKAQKIDVPYGIWNVDQERYWVYTLNHYILLKEESIKKLAKPSHRCTIS